MEGNLAAEVIMIVLDTLDLILQILIASDTFNQVLPHVLKVLLDSLSLNQSARVLVHMFAMQRSLVTKVIGYQMYLLIMTFTLYSIHALSCQKQ